MKYAKILDGKVDSIALQPPMIPDAVWIEPTRPNIPDPNYDGEGSAPLIPDPNWIKPKRPMVRDESYIEIAYDVFGGFIANADGTFTAPPKPPKPFDSLSRPAFFFMMKQLGITQGVVPTQLEKDGIVAGMPTTTKEEIDAKDVAIAVLEYQQTFERSNALLNTLAAAKGLTQKQVDDAWRIGEAIRW